MEQGRRWVAGGRKGPAQGWRAGRLHSASEGSPPLPNGADIPTHASHRFGGIVTGVSGHFQPILGWRLREVGDAAGGLGCALPPPEKGARAAARGAIVLLYNGPYKSIHTRMV
jgi:hypothetical protein